MKGFPSFANDDVQALHCFGTYCMLDLYCSSFHKQL